MSPAREGRRRGPARTPADNEGHPDVDDGETGFGNQYSDWTPELIRAAHNYQLARKDPGAYVHNFPYITQLLIDSIDALGGDVSGYTRP